MTVPYEYLIAGLPDMFLEETKTEFSLGEFISDLAELVPAADATLLPYTALLIDNQNLISILQNTGVPFNRSGLFDEETLQDEIKNPDLAPSYMQDFITAYNENIQLFPGLSWENQLHWLFYEEVLALENTFLVDWFTFDLNLRNILAAINCRESGKQIDHHVIYQNEVTDLLLKSNAPDFSLGAKVSWSDQVFSMDLNEIADSESKLAEFRLERLDDIASFNLFSIDTILSFCIRLAVIERWGLLDDETGKQKLDQIIQDMETSYQAAL